MLGDVDAARAGAPEDDYPVLSNPVEIAPPLWVAT